MSDERQRAIETLKEHLAHWERLLKEYICDETEGKNTIEAFKMSISSLETDEAYQLEYEHPEFCGDCISREATKEAIRKRFPSLHDRCEVNIVINSMPSVLPKADVLDNNVREIRDCISRKDTIEYLKQVTVTDGITFETGFKQILLDIENMPCVLPKEKWILKNVDKSVLKIECPRCSFKRYVLKETLLKFKYCPNCGADLREDDIDENIS